jgi:hypothetical protein
VSGASLTILYRFDGFLQPINDTAHQTTCVSPCAESIFNAGATVPVKFQTKNVNGNPVGPDATLPTFQAQQVGTTNSSVDETNPVATATTGNTFQWDSTSQQYTYNWKTSKSMSGQQWQITATLADGQAFSVTIGLE